MRETADGTPKSSQQNCTSDLERPLGGGIARFAAKYEFQIC